MNIIILLTLTIYMNTNFCERNVTCVNDVESDSLRIPVKVKNWGKSAYFFRKDYWNDPKKKSQIIAQLGEDGLAKVVKFSDRRYIPCQLQQFCEDVNGSRKKNLDSLNAKRSKLVVYQIAEYSYTTVEGKLFNRVILEVPYLENKEWDLSAKWDVIYFVIPKEEVEIMQ